MLQHHHREILAAAPDALARAFGIPERNEHPLAADLSSAPLSRLAYACGLAARPQQTHETDRAVVGRGMMTADFAEHLAKVGTRLANARFNAAAEHRRFCAIVEAPNFRPVEFAQSGVNLDLPEVGEFQEIGAGEVLIGGGTRGQLHTFAKILSAARDVILADQAGVIADATAAMGAAGARTEAREVYGAMEKNPNLDDGAPVFHEDHGNVIASALDGTSLGQGMAALRTMTLIGGNVADLTAEHLVVAADLELAARKLIHESGLQITVTASSRLPVGRWYLLPSNAVAPAIAVLHLRGSSDAVAIEPWRERDMAFDGAQMRARVDTGALWVSRTAIRGGA